MFDLLKESVQMKKEGLLMLIAGVVLGTVLGFIGTRQFYVDRAGSAAAQAQQQAVSAAPAQGGQPGQEAFDPAQHESMLAAIKAELEKDPTNVEKRVMLGNIYYDGQKYDQAIPWYQEALKLDPNNTDVLVDLGVCLRNLKRYDEALAMFDRALKVDPGKKQALFNKVVVYHFDVKDKAKADAVLKDLTARYPDDPMVKQLVDEVKK